MRIRVLIFGSLKDLLGKSNDAVELPEGATLAELLARYEKAHPKLKALLPAIAMSINQEYAAPSRRLADADEVALLPPVSGGTDEERAADVSIVEKPIDTAAVLKEIKANEDGAVAVFEGIVRNHSRGRRTLFLEYEAYVPMALAQMEELADRALDQFEIRDVVMVHRLGRLEIGETSVLIAVASAHRGPAFDACRWLIDTLKKKVPIWKKEHFEDGAIWADGEPFPAEIPSARVAKPPRRASK